MAIYEGQDGPLETTPDPNQEGMNRVDFNLAGRPDMLIAELGTKDL